MSVAPYEVRRSTHQQDAPSSGNYGAKPAHCSTLNRVMNFMFFFSSTTNKTIEKLKKKKGRRIPTSKVKCSPWCFQTRG